MLKMNFINCYRKFIFAVPSHSDNWSVTIMANLRVFVSSTSYDLKQVRDNLKNFIEGCGYEPVMNEHHQIPYNVTETLETDCYTEINNCDIVVGIVGGRYGTDAKGGDGKSISMKEMLSAIERGKQVYIFIDRDVNSEHNTYLKQMKNGNKVSSADYCYIDNIAIFEFISEIRKNSRLIINSFSSANDIVSALKTQWGSLFQNLLNNRERNKEDSVLEDFTKKFDEFAAQNKQIEELIREGQPRRREWYFYHPKMMEEILYKGKIPKKLACKMIFGPLAKEAPWLYDICMEIVNISSRELRLRRIDELRRMSGYMIHTGLYYPEMDELYHGEFWMMLQGVIDSIDRREEKAASKRSDKKEE